MKSRLSSAQIDKTGTEAIVLLFFSDERPLKGASGLIDWRMNGAISRLIAGGMIKGERGESILMVPKSRIKAGKILMAGLGKSSELNKDALSESAGALMKQLVKIGVNKFSISLPPEPLLPIKTRDAARAVVEGMISAAEKEKINHSKIFATISMDSAFLQEAKLELDKLNKELKGLETTR